MGHAPVLVIDDDSIDPYDFRLHHPGGEPTLVSVDPTALDERNEYLIRWAEQSCTAMPSLLELRNLPDPRDGAVIRGASSR